jgi:methyl-accepting chemotaxis protein
VSDWLSNASLRAKLRLFGGMAIAAFGIASVALLISMFASRANLDAHTKKLQVADALDVLATDIASAVRAPQIVFSSGNVKEARVETERRVGAMNASADRYRAVVVEVGESISERVEGELRSTSKIAPLANEMLEHFDAKSTAEAEGMLIAAQASFEAATDAAARLDAVERSIFIVLNARQATLRADTSASLDRAHATQSNSFVALLVLFLAGGLGSWYLGRRVLEAIVPPIEHLTRVTDEIVERGDLTQRVEVTSGDEIGKLSRSFQRMVERLREVPATISGSVDELSSVTQTLAGTVNGIASGGRQLRSRVENTTGAISGMRTSLLRAEEGARTVSRDADDIDHAINDFQQVSISLHQNADTFSGRAEGTVAAIEEMTAILAEVAKNIEKLRNETDGSAASMTQLKAALGEVGEDAERTSRASDRLLTEAQSGSDAVAALLQGIADIRSTMGHITTVIDSFAVRAREVGGIVVFLREILDETGLVGLNARILASQAGTMGQTFEVVASQVVDLSRRTRDSTERVAALIGDLQQSADAALDVMEVGETHVARGVELGEVAAGRLVSIQDSAQHAQVAVRRIAKTVGVSADEVSRAAGAIGNVAQLTAQMSRAASEQADAAKSIRDMAYEMGDAVQSVRAALTQQRSAVAAVRDTAESTRAAVSELQETQVVQTRAADDLKRLVEDVREVAGAQATRVGELEEVIGVVEIQGATLTKQVSRFRT